MGIVTNQLKIDGRKLHKLQLQSTTADALINYFSSRGRIRGFTDIKRLQMDLSRATKFEIVEKDALAFFDALQKDGYGRIVFSREAGGRARFVWSVDMRTLANAAINEQEVYVEPLKDSLVRECDAPRLKRKQNTSYPVSLLVQRQLQEEMKNENSSKPKQNTSLRMVEHKPTSTSLVDQMVINGETYIKIDPKELEQIIKLREMLKLMGK